MDPFTEVQSIFKDLTYLGKVGGVFVWVTGISIVTFDTENETIFLNGDEVKRLRHTKSFLRLREVFEGQHGNPPTEIILNHGYYIAYVKGDPNWYAYDGDNDEFSMMED